MKDELTAEINNTTRKAYQEFLMQWQFEWFLTVRLPSKNYSFYLKQIRDAFLREEHGQIGYIGIFVNGYSGKHMHILMLGRFSGSRTLRDISHHKWKMKIAQIVRDKKGGKIEPVYDLSGAVKYIFKEKNTPLRRYELLKPWGRILNKTKCSVLLENDENMVNIMDHI